MWGGNGWITQAAPTNFHSFWKQKILGPDESIDDFREVTDKEKAALEKSDAKWEKPSEEVRELARQEMIVFNEDTGYFEYNTLYDLTTANVLAILAAGKPQGTDSSFFYARNDNIRTNLHPRFVQGHYKYCTSMFQGCHYIEVIDASCMIPDVTTFFGCKRLHTIINMYSITGPYLAQGCFNVPSLRKLYGDIAYEGNADLKKCPLLDVDSFEYWIAHKTIEGAATVTLHPDAYARLTEELIAAAAEKNIVFATT